MGEDNLYTKMLLVKKLCISCNELDNDINTLLKDKLVKAVGNRCLNEGYIRGDSINIVSRTIGKINPNHFNGDVYYNVQYEADICNPSKDMVVECIIKNINQMGIMAERDCLIIVIAKQLMDPSIDMNIFRIGEKINITIVGSRFDLNDKQITVVGKLS